MQLIRHPWLHDLFNLDNLNFIIQVVQRPLEAKMSIDDLPVDNLPDNCVLIAGGGPVGLMLATTLAHHGVRSILLERNKTTTRCKAT